MSDFEIPAMPDPGCLTCRGEGHVGESPETGRWKACPVCYPNAADTVMEPLELIAALNVAKDDPQQWALIQQAIAEREAIVLDQQWGSEFPKEAPHAGECVCRLPVLDAERRDREGALSGQCAQAGISSVWV